MTGMNVDGVGRLVASTSPKGIAPRAMALCFEVELSPRALSPNGNKGGHWGRKSGPTETYKYAAFVSCKSADGFPALHVALGTNPHVVLSLEFCVKGSRGKGTYAPRDVDNAVASFKAAKDGIALALAIPDTAKHMALGAVTIRSDCGPFVRVVVEEVLA